MRRFVIEHLFLTLKICFMVVEFGFGSSFFITDLQDSKETQRRNLQVLLEGIIFPWQGVKLSMTVYSVIIRLKDILLMMYVTLLMQ